MLRAAFARGGRRPALALALLLAPGAAAAPGTAEAAPRLRAARAEVRLTAPTECAVALELTIDGADEVEHRLDTRAGTAVDVEGIDGATSVGPPADVGRTRALTLRPAGDAYTLRYRVTLPEDRAYHCPIWLPAAPADGRTRRVVLQVTLPDGATTAGTMPSLQWTGSRGEAVVGHLPAVVVVPYAAAGEPRRWDVARLMDGVAIATLVVGSLGWASRTRSRRRDHEESRP